MIELDFLVYEEAGQWVGEVRPFLPLGAKPFFSCSDTNKDEVLLKMAKFAIYNNPNSPAPTLCPHNLETTKWCKNCYEEFEENEQAVSN
jgi:hypothetical protein